MTNNKPTNEQLRKYITDKIKNLEFVLDNCAFTSIRSGLEAELKMARIALESMDAPDKCAAMAAELSVVEAIHNDAVCITDDHYDLCPPEVQKVISALAAMHIPACGDFIASVRKEAIQKARQDQTIFARPSASAEEILRRVNKRLYGDVNPLQSASPKTATCNITLQQGADINRITVKLGPVPVGSLWSQKYSKAHFVNELLAVEDVGALSVADAPSGELAYLQINLHDFVSKSREEINLSSGDVHPFSETIRKAVPVLQDLLELSIMSFAPELSNSGGTNN